MSSEDLYINLLSLIERSEERIDRTNGMIEQLASTCAKNTEMYDKHLCSLEQSRNIAQENAAASIEVSKNLSDMIALLRKDYQDQLTSLKAELHSLTNEYRKEMDEIRRDYKELSASYRRLAEHGIGGSKSEVKINHI